MTDNGKSARDRFENRPSNQFDPDRPQLSANRDRLGFRRLAQRLAASMLQQSPNDGYVVGIEGTWGSGKTTLINFLLDELRASPSNPPAIVKFDPWVVGEKDAMLSELMADLASAVEAIDAPATSNRTRLQKDARKLAVRLKSYGSKLSKTTAPLAHLANVLGVPFAALASGLLGGVANAADAIDLSKTVDQSKDELLEGLRKLPKRIVVVVDDLDRLEPAEVAEVLRLVRAVADFPNVVYVLGYDPKVLANNLKTALHIDDGDAFLKKIVQVSFKVPLAEAFDLRRWFLEECVTLYQDVLGTKLSGKVEERLREVCMIEGNFIRTPRDIARIVNAVRLFWPAVSENVDFADMVWLQTIKSESEDLYAWIESYLVDYMVVGQGASIAESEKERFAVELRKHILDNLELSAKSIWRFRQIIPGIRSETGFKEKNLLFDSSSKTEVASRTSDRRLGSPQHFRYYFAFGKPSDAIEDSQLRSFIAAAQKGSDIEALIDTLAREPRSQGGTMMSVMLDRLQYLGVADLPSTAAKNLLLAFSNLMDDVATREGRGDWGQYWTWSAAKTLAHRYLAQLTDEQRDSVIKSMFGKGRAIGWLLSELISSEAAAHGRHGYKGKLTEEWCLTPKQLDCAIKLVLDRLNARERQNLVKTPGLLHLLIVWKEIGSEQDVLKWAGEQQETDAGLIDLLQACREWRSSSSKGLYYPLTRAGMSNFLDFDLALSRLRQIAANPSSDEAQRKHANELLEAARQGQND